METSLLNGNGLTSSRLVFRMMTETDGDLMLDLDSDPAVMRFISDGKPTTPEDVQQKMIPRLQSYMNPEKGWGIWNAFLKDSGEYVGWILVRPMHFFSGQPEFDNLELGWRFKQKYWGQGFATEAAEAVYEWVKPLNQLTRICAIVDKDNHGSIGVMKKLGMNWIKTIHYKDELLDEELEYYEKNL